MHLDWQTASRVVAVSRHVYVIRHPAGTVTGTWTRTTQRSPHVRVQVSYPSYATPQPAGYWITVSATGYDDVGLTATGTQAGYGGCAADPAYLPYGTVIDAPGYGRCVIVDTGGGGPGWIDFWWPTASQCNAWTGNRRVFVYGGHHG